MPELPDLAVVAEAFHAALAGRRLTDLSAAAPLVLRATPAEGAELVGQKLDRIDRRGKFLVFVFERERLIANPMLTGRFGLGARAAGRTARPAAAFSFGPRSGRPAEAAAWTVGQDWLPLDGDETVVRYHDAAQMGKLYLIPAGSDRAVPGYGGDQGPDADDPALTVEMWRARIRRHPGELKNLLRNQAFVAGIGNAYSDEILHAARLLPFRARRTLAGEEVDDLYEGMRSTLAEAIDVLRVRVPPTFEKQARDFLAVHRRGGEPCPRCGTRLSQVQAGGQATTYCRGCQR